MSKGPIISAIGGGALLLSVPFIASWEGKSNDPYVDIVGIPTVCYGETRVPMKTYSDAQCLAMLREAVKGFEAQVVKCTPNLATRPYQLAAATSLAYNIGASAYCHSTADRRFDQGRFKEGCEAIKMWNKGRVRGKITVIKGLTNRREAEYKLCVTYLTSGADSRTT